MKKIFQIIPVFSLLLIVFMTYANEVDDLDLWWHLKQGQLIYETHAIPQRDDFAYTTYISGAADKANKDKAGQGGLLSEDTSRYWATSIKRNWFSQLIFYIVYLFGGFTGIGLLKSAVFVLAYLVLYLAMLRNGAGHLSSFFVLCLVALIGTDFNYTRSQIFSFLMLPCVLYALYDFRSMGRSIYFLPLLMLVWANLHGGFILGVLIILVFISAESIKYLLHNRFGMSKLSCLNKERLRTLLLIAPAAVFASLINPNTYKAFLFPLYQEQSIFMTIQEYHSPMLYEYHLYWLMLVLVIVSILILILKKHLDPGDLFIALIVIFASLKSIRYIIFFALGTGVFLAYSTSYTGARLKERKPFKKLFDNPKFHRLNLKTFSSLLIAVLSIIVLIKISVFGDVLKFDMREKRYPSGAVEFIRENSLPGNMFNLYNWGGHLVWNLYPDYRVFIYGRTLNETAFQHARQIVRAENGKGIDSPLWKKLLDGYNVNFILTSAVSSDGNIIPLVDRLYDDSDWELIFADGKSMIFLRAAPENQNIIHQHYLSKDKIYDEIIIECKRGIAETPAAWAFYKTLGYVYMKKNRLNDALTMFQKYLSMNPYNKQVRDSYELLRRYLKQ